MNSRFILTAAGVAFVLSACSVIGAGPSPGASPTATAAPSTTLTTAPATTSPSPAPTITPQPSTSAKSDLNGRQFVAVLVTEDGKTKVLVPGSKIRLGFADGMISASAGCNGMGGAYHLAAGKLAVDDMATTDMGCQSDLMVQDEWLADFLGSNPTVALDGNDLVLTSGTTEMTLLDREQAEPDQPLTGITWTLSTLIDGDAASSIPTGIVATLLFADDGTFTYSDGCNSGSGKYATNGDAISFSEVISTKKACLDDGALTVEQAVTAIFNATDATYAIDHSTLSLQAADHGLQYGAALDVN